MEGTQINFLLMSLFVYCLASVDFLVNYGFPHYPFGVIAILLSLAISAYAILRFRLMDIRLAISNTAIFIVVYAAVLATPFYLYAIGSKLIALFLMFVLASLGPYILLNLQKRAKENILKEDKRIQDTLINSSRGFSIIRDLKQLLNLVTKVLSQVLGLNDMTIYLYESEIDSYVLKNSLQTSKDFEIISSDNNLIKSLNEKKYPIVYEEVKFSSDGIKRENIESAQVATSMQILFTAVAIPIMGEKQLMGFILLGEREEKATFSSDLINVLSIVGNAIAHSLEIIMYMKEKEKLLIENFRASQFETLALLCASVSHQMDNRFHGIIYSLEVPLVF